MNVLAWGTQDGSLHSVFLADPRVLLAVMLHGEDTVATFFVQSVYVCHMSEASKNLVKHIDLADVTAFKLDREAFLPPTALPSP